MTHESQQSPEILNTDFLNTILELVFNKLLQSMQESQNLLSICSNNQEYQNALQEKLKLNISLSQEQVLEICEQNNNYDYTSALKYFQEAQKRDEESKYAVFNLNQYYIIKKCISILILFRQKILKDQKLNDIPINLALNDKGFKILCLKINDEIKYSFEAAFADNDFNNIIDMLYRFSKQPKSLNQFRESYINDGKDDQQINNSEINSNLTEQLVIIIRDILISRLRILNTVLNIKTKD